MKTQAAPLIAHLATGGPYLMADLYTITPAGGAALHWADYDLDIVHPGNGYTYSSSGPVLKRGKTRSVIGVQMDTLDLSIYPRSSDTLNGTTLLAAAQAGAFDGARLTLERVFLTAPNTAIGVDHRFAGRFADLILTRTEIQARINSDAESLAVQLPRNLYQPGCMHSLYDTGCGLVRATWAAASTVASGSTTTTINCGLAQAAKWFDRGYVQFSGGALDGLRRTVKGYSPGVISLFQALPSVPAAGANFTAYPGCDKTLNTCTGKFSNQANFRGCPFIPVAETAI